MRAPWRGFVLWQTCLAWNITDPPGEGFWWDAGIDKYPITHWVPSNCLGTQVENQRIPPGLWEHKGFFSKLRKALTGEFRALPRTSKSGAECFSELHFFFVLSLMDVKPLAWPCTAPAGRAFCSLLWGKLFAWFSIIWDVVPFPCSWAMQRIVVLLRRNFALSSLKSLSSEVESHTGGFLRPSLGEFISEMRWIWVILCCSSASCTAWRMGKGWRWLTSSCLPLSAARSRRINLCQIH